MTIFKGKSDAFAPKVYQAPLGLPRIQCGQVLKIGNLCRSDDRDKKRSGLADKSGDSGS